VRTLSLNMREAHEAETSDVVEIALFVFEHPDLAAPVRLSTDPTERLSEDEEVYGTRSTWNGADPANEPYLFVVMEAEMPGDQAEAPAAARLVLSSLDRRVIDALRSVTVSATAHLAIVTDRTPDLVELEFRDMLLVVADYDDNVIELTLSRQAIEDEPFPAPRMTKRRFPGLFR